jgi:hypothetical protein
MNRPCHMYMLLSGENMNLEVHGVSRCGADKVEDLIGVHAGRTASLRAN